MRVAVVLLLVALLLLGAASVAQPVSCAGSEDALLHFARQVFSLGGRPASGDEGGGVNCAVCVVVVSLVEQLAVLHEKSVDQTVAELCNLFPAELQQPCKAAINAFGPIIIAALEKKETPEVACHQASLCTSLKCQLSGSNRDQYWRNVASAKQGMSLSRMPPHSLLRENGPSQTQAGLGETPWEWIYKQMLRVFDDHKPLVDLDADGFSVVDTFRGTDWRGRDCNDLDKTVYPGRAATTQPDKVDHNCNGIFGTTPQGSSFEDALCKDSQSKGVAVLGDSAAAHFHIPGEWITAAAMKPSIYEHALFAIENEMDWPQMSAYTGFTNKSFDLVHGPMQSIYGLMRERNLCNHRDYQNIAVNGARSGSMYSSIAGTLSRNQDSDKPLLTLLALIGNDVCNGHPTFDHMTTPEQFEQNTMNTLGLLDTKLPYNSTVILVGLVDGRILYDTMHALIHPIGVTYKDVYNYLNCLEINPCWGWLNEDESVRNKTTEHALSLNAVYSKIQKTQSFKHFNLLYYSFADLIDEAIEEWKAAGHQVSDLIEPVDGFHPSQEAMYLISKLLWKHLSEEHPDVLGPVNPNNGVIKNLFGDQGGY